MNKAKSLILLILLIGVFSIQSAFASEYTVNTVGVNGYDLVTYHSEKRPLRGNGNYVSVHDGVTYLFTSESNKKKFDKNPEKYLPAYGGWCAYGVAVGKKFAADPEVWEIVDGKLYLNLDSGIKKEWRKDIPGNIKKANANWKKIRDKSPDQL